jgi:hypothetical protein
MSSNSSDGEHESHHLDDEKREVTALENIKTRERIPGHTNYYEKDGLRTYGDDEDHEHEPPVSFNAKCPLDCD